MITISIDSSDLQKALGTLSSQFNYLTPIMHKLAGTMVAAKELA